MKHTDQPFVAMPFDETATYPQGSYLAGRAWEDGEFSGHSAHEYQIVGDSVAEWLDKLEDRFPPYSNWSYTTEVRVPLFCSIDQLNAALDAVTRPKAA